MGLFDGAPPDGKGATADLARILGLPVVLVVDAARMAQSVAPLVAGFVAPRPTGARRRRDPEPCRQPATRGDAAPRPDRHRPAGAGRPSTPDRPCPPVAPPRSGAGQERPDLDGFLDTVADTVDAAVDLDALCGSRSTSAPGDAPSRSPPPAQRIAVARDAAFAFTYPHLLADWRNAGAEIAFFSPLADDPVPAADLIVLPGGYPELHAGASGGKRHLPGQPQGSGGHIGRSTANAAATWCWAKP